MSTPLLLTLLLTLPAQPVTAQIIHSLLWTPYFSWKISHHRHHMNHASIERDEVYVPKTRRDLGIPPRDADVDWEDYFGDTPVYTLYMLVRQQLLAFEAYLCGCQYFGNII